MLLLALSALRRARDESHESVVAPGHRSSTSNRSGNKVFLSLSVEFFSPINECIFWQYLFKYRPKYVDFQKMCTHRFFPKIFGTSERAEIRRRLIVLPREIF